MKESLEKENLKENLINLLKDLRNNCPDILGRDGEYLDVKVSDALKIIDKIFS